LPRLRLRDRDSIQTKEGLIFRVFGYSHPTNAYICDVEYAPSGVFKSDDPKALRSRGDCIYYKFYSDEGWKFLQTGFPQYLIFHRMLRTRVLGVRHHDILNVRKPEEELERLIRLNSRDQLSEATKGVLKLVAEHSRLSTKDFGVFGSMLHGFHHPMFSDIDLVIYDGKNLADLRQTLQELYFRDSSGLSNEFETEAFIREKRWQFENLHFKEFLWHQHRKLIYALFHDKRNRRIIKTEFEPVKAWGQISNEYDSDARIMQKGWVQMRARIVQDDDAPFIPSIYGIEPLEVMAGTREAYEAKRIISYMEEFRLQVRKDETVYVEGNLEEMITGKKAFHQVALTYCPRYFEQVLKVCGQALT
jgi:predicted nucleotidyltransferase